MMNESSKIQGNNFYIIQSFIIGKTILCGSAQPSLVINTGKMSNTTTFATNVNSITQ